MNLRLVSHQDQSPTVALMHNSEAMHCAKAALVLAQEYGIPAPDGLQELYTDIRNENEASVSQVEFEY